ncbi:MAG: hypothetical protein LLF89_06830 [Spirochaetaceae bacterium]|nr:hypothetical protein [Spirochaetaceae bacterium]
MTRRAKAAARDHIIESFVAAFRKELKRDPGYDIRARIDREKRAEIRGAMLAAEREVYREMRGK